MTATEAREALAAATAARDEIRAFHRESEAAHRAARSALGPEPRVDPDPGTAVPPARTEPTAESLAAAEALVASQDAIQRAHRAHVEELARHRQADADAAARKADTAQAARRGQVQLDAARTAGEGIGAAALGDLGPVRVIIPERPATATAADPYVLFDTGSGARVYAEHSGGERRLVDYHLALGLRRLAATSAPLARHIPVGVDEAGSWSGNWTTTSDPSVFLVAVDADTRIELAVPRRMEVERV